MSANPLELFMAYAGATASTAVAGVFPSERRKRTRTRVHWPVLLFRKEPTDAIASITADLSSSGFYCITRVPFSVGETLTCSLKMPSHDPNGKIFERNLECRVRVVRVEPNQGHSGFGVGCAIEDYHFADMVPACGRSAAD